MIHLAQLKWSNSICIKISTAAENRMESTVISLFALIEIFPYCFEKAIENDVLVSIAKITKACSCQYISLQIRWPQFRVRDLEILNMKTWCCQSSL